MRRDWDRGWALNPARSRRSWSREASERSVGFAGG